MLVIWPWIQTRLIGVWSCLMETLWPHFSRRLSRTPDLPQRFDGWTQVLCLQPLSSDRYYWEVEWRGAWLLSGCGQWVHVPQRADFRGGAWVITANRGAWSCQTCAAQHARQSEGGDPCDLQPSSRGVLDRTAGTLTFYSVDDELVPLHAFQGSFPPPLYAAFGGGLWGRRGLDFAMGQFSSTSDSIKICPLWTERISQK